MTCVADLNPPLFRLDIAVMEDLWVNNIKKLDPLSQHLIDMDIIDISYNDFKALYYFNDPVNPTFSVLNISTSNPLYNLMSFSNRLRTKDCGVRFCLYDEILNYYCLDAQVLSTQFSPSSLITLNKQINAIKTVYDVYINRTGDILNNCSLSWNDIINSVLCEYNDQPTIPATVTVILTITCIFIQTPASLNGNTFKPVVVKFNYRIILPLASLSR